MQSDRRRPYLVTLLAAALALAACGGGAGEPLTETSPDAGGATSDTDTGAPTDGSGAVLAGTVRLYTSVTQDTVDAVVAAYRDAQPEVEVETFRAPTGELTARIAAEQREGRIRADVLWLTDPLSMQPYAADGLLRAWEPAEAEAVPADLQQDTFWGTRILNIVATHHTDVDAPSSWQDLADHDYAEPVAIPDPGFAGSAFGALAYFALSEDLGFDYYRTLSENGLVQVQSPGEVITGVAEGRFAAGMSLDKSVRDAVDDGSPIALVAPEPGAIAIYSPIAVVDGTAAPDLAESFANFTLTVEAQEAIASTGWQPVRSEVPWPHQLPQVFPDWETAFDQREELLETYRSIVGG